MIEALFEWNGFSHEVYGAMLAAFILSILAILFHIRVSKLDPLEKPPRFLIILEGLYKFLDDLVKQVFGDKNKLIVPYAITLFVFILTMNYLPLFALTRTSPTTNYNVTLALALVTLILSQIVNIKDNGVTGYFKGYFEPMPLMAPLNLMDLFSRPASLSIRLFGNMTSGMMIIAVVNMGTMALQQTLFPGAADFPIDIFAIFINVPLSAYFDIFAGGLQALVFTMLSIMYMSI